MAGTSCLSIVKSGVQRTNQRQSRLVGLLGRGLADGAWKRSSGQSFPPRILALARQPNVLSLEPPGNGRRYTSITSIPFLRSSSVNSRVARLSVIRRRILSNGPIFETLLRPSLLKSVTTLTSFAERIILGGLQAPHGAAVRSNHCADRRESIKVIADRDGRNRELSRHIRDGYLALLVNEVQHTPASLFC